MLSGIKFDDILRAIGIALAAGMIYGGAMVLIVAIAAFVDLAFPGRKDGKK